MIAIPNMIIHNCKTLDRKLYVKIQENKTEEGEIEIKMALFL